MKKFVISESQEKELKRILKEEAFQEPNPQTPSMKKANKPYCINPDKVLIVKKFLDKGFTPHDWEKIGNDGLPMKIKIFSMNASNGEPLKWMYQDQLHDLLIDHFQNMFLDHDERDLFMKQVLKDWINGAIGVHGTLSTNRLMEGAINESNYDEYYHCTTLDGLATMIQTNQIKLSNSDGLESKFRGNNNLFYLSLTRSKSISQGYVQKKWVENQSGGNGVVRLTIDGIKLNNLKGVSIKPFDYMFNMLKTYGSEPTTVQGMEGSHNLDNARLFTRYGAINFPENYRKQFDAAVSGPQLYGQNDVSSDEMYTFEKTKLKRQPFSQSEESLTFSDRSIDHIDNFDRLVKRIDILISSTSSINVSIDKKDHQQQWNSLYYAIGELFGNRWADNPNMVCGYGDKMYFYFDKSQFDAQRGGINLYNFIVNYVSKNGIASTLDVNIGAGMPPKMPSDFKGLNNRVINEITSESLAAEANNANTDPSDAQKEAGNYKMGHVSVKGMRISIENPRGSYRKYKTEDGVEGKNLMKNHYGYFNVTKGKDGDAVDCFLGPDIEHFDTVYCVDQNKKDGSFDETKVMLGFDSEREAAKAYLSNYSPDWDGLRCITAVSLKVFKRWLYRGRKQRIPFSDYVYIQKKKLSEGAEINESGLSPRMKVATMWDEKAAIEVAEEIDGYFDGWADGEADGKDVYIVFEYDPAFDDADMIGDYYTKAKKIAKQYAITHSEPSTSVVSEGFESLPPLGVYNNYIDTDPENVKKGKRFEIGPAYEGWIRVRDRINHKMNLKKEGSDEFISEEWFSWIGYLIKGIAIVSVDGKGYNLINEDGQIVLPEWHEDIHEEDGGEVYILIDDDGERKKAKLRKDLVK